jgi:hypothetical protein
MSQKVCGLHGGLAPPLSFVGTIHNRGCPTLRDFRSVGTTDDDTGALAEVAPQLVCGLQAAVVTNEPAVEVRGAHLPKIAEGGAASVRMAPAIKQIRGGPATPGFAS